MRELNPRWTTIQGEDTGPVDQFGAIPAPSPADLLRLNSDSVYACSDWCANAVAKNEYRALVRTTSEKTFWPTVPIVHKSGAVRQVLDHPFLDLLKRPNPHMSGYDMLYYTDSQMSVVGNCYWFMQREEYEPSQKVRDGSFINDGLPVRLWPLLTQHVDIEAAKGHVVGYSYSLESTPVFYRKEDIIHFKMISATNPYAQGYGPVAAAYERILLGKNELAYLNSLFRNQARPDSLALVKGGATADQCERLQKELNMRFKQGGIGGIYAVDADDMDLKPLGWSPKDVLGTELYKYTKLQIINAFGLNAALFDTESSNRAVATQARRQSQEQAIEPRLRLIEEKINQQLTTEFDERLFLEFDNPVEEDRDFEHALAKDMVDRGALTINEWRHKQGLKSVTWGDKPMEGSSGKDASSSESQQPPNINGQQG